MSRKLKIPKRIAGLKIPKAVRKGPAGKFLKSSAGQLLVAQALLVSESASTSEGLSHACAEALKAFRSALLEEKDSLRAEAAKKKQGSTSASTPH